MKLQDLQNQNADELIGFFGANNSKKPLAQKFIALGLPTKKQEEYRYADIESYTNMPLDLARSSAPKPEPSERVIITDGVLTHAPKSLQVTYIDDIALDQEHFDSLYYLSHLASKRSFLISLDDDTKLEIHHKFTKPASLFFYRIALDVAPNTTVELFETYDGNLAKNSLAINGYDIRLNEYSSMSMVKSQTVSADTCRTLSSHAIDVKENAQIDFSSFDYGDGYSLQSILINLSKRAHAQASHLLYVNKNAKRGTVSKIRHIGEHSTSNQVAKNILDGKSRGIFDALIKVENSALHTKAHQNSKSILLQSGAYMASKPQLEIYIDELEASHGSSIGQLDENQLFYLRSRGISESEAKKMLVQAFANDIIDRVSDISTKESVSADFERSYYGQVQLECMETCHGCEDLITKDMK